LIKSAIICKRYNHATDKELNENNLFFFRYELRVAGPKSLNTYGLTMKKFNTNTDIFDQN